MTTLKFNYIEWHYKYVNGQATVKEIIFQTQIIKGVYKELK